MGLSHKSKTDDFVIQSEAKNQVFVQVLDSSLHFVPFRMTLMRQPLLLLVEQTFLSVCLKLGIRNKYYLFTLKVSISILYFLILLCKVSLLTPSWAAALLTLPNTFSKVLSIFFLSTSSISSFKVLSL
jgi:hypothetical protein